jgi:quercetin dioxygenase-like cupin family protein
MMSDDVFDLGPTRLRVVAATDEATVLEGVLQPGAGGGWHKHTREDETIVVLEGRLVVDDGERHELGTGDAHVLPRERRHAFVNDGETPTRVLFFCAPGGLERFFRDLANGIAPDEAAARAGVVFG